MVDVATYAFHHLHEALNFQRHCGYSMITASLPKQEKNSWNVRVLIQNNFERQIADKYSDGAPVVKYSFRALPAPIDGLEYRHF